MSDDARTLVKLVFVAALLVGSAAVLGAAVRVFVIIAFGG